MLYCHDSADEQCSQRSIPCAFVSGLAHGADAGGYTPAHSNTTICGLELTFIWLPKMYGYSFKLDFVNLW